MKQNYITMVNSPGNKLIKILYIFVQAPHNNMIIYVEVMSTGLIYGIFKNTGAMSIGLAHNDVSDMGTMFAGLRI